MTAAAATVAATPPPTHYHRTGGRLAHLLLVRDYLPECDAAALLPKDSTLLSQKKNRWKKKFSSPAYNVHDLSMYMRPAAERLLNNQF